MSTIAPCLVPQSVEDVQRLLGAAIKKRKKREGGHSARDVDENGIRINGNIPNPFDTSSKEMRGVIQSLGLDSKERYKDSNLNNPKKIEVRKRLNKVVNAVIDGFIGQDDDQMQNITNLVRNLLITDPKGASQLLQRLLPKQIDLNLENVDRIKSSIVLVDKSQHIHVSSAKQDQQNQQDQNIIDELPRLRPKLSAVECNKANLMAGLPVDPTSVKHAPLVAPLKDNSPEELERFSNELKEKSPKYLQMLELKKHFPEIKIPKFYVMNYKAGMKRKQMAAKRGRPKYSVPHAEKALVSKDRPKFDADVAEKAEKYKARRLQQQNGQNGDL